MAKIFYIWEMGGGWGHVRAFEPVGRELVRRGHEVFMGIKDSAMADAAMAQAGLTCLPIPIRLHFEKDRPRSITYADILATVGYLHSERLAGLVRTWRNLLDLVDPDLVLFDHAPTALLATRDLNRPRITFGNGFFHPPPRRPLPPMRYWERFSDEQLLERELPVLASMNEALNSHSLPPLERLADLFDLDCIMLRTLPNLDHYPGRKGAHYFGAPLQSDGRGSITWPSGDGKRIYCYLNSDYIHLEKFLQACRRNGQRFFIVCSGLPKTLEQKYSGDRIRFSARPVDIGRATGECDVAVTHGGNGTTTAFLQKGRPVLLLPKYAEQVIFAKLVESSGAGIALTEGADTRLAHERGLRRLLEDRELAHGARRIAADCSRIGAYPGLTGMADMIESFLTRQPKSGA